MAGLGLLAVAGLLGLTGWAAQPNLPSAGAVPPAHAASTPPQLVTPRVNLWGRPPPAVPARLSLPALRVEAPVVPVTVLRGGELNVPPDPQVLGWWQSGAGPGDPTGTVVLAGHVDTARDGPGALFDLPRARPGQEILLETSQGLRRYQITALRSYRKADLPAETFAADGQPRLVLITCGGPFDEQTRRYAYNVVAYAIPR